MATSGYLETNHVDIDARALARVAITWRDGIIESIEPLGAPEDDGPYLLPGFVDAHVHIESSLLPPAEFARLAVRHGTVAAVCDPHEIANVLGEAGVQAMLADAATTPFHFLFGAPSCVPATPFETAGAALDAAAIGRLLATPGIGFLAEVMNFPGVLAGDEEMLARIAQARERGLPVDGHAPGLRGADAARYAAAGISTDHECRTLEEATDKLAAGMRVLIREGSAARDFDRLAPLIATHADRLMFCSDDKHPDDLLAGHIDRLVTRAVAAGHDLFDVLRIACLNPVDHYRLPVGRLRPGEAFDAVLVEDLRSFRPLATWLGGRCVARDGQSLLTHRPATAINRWQPRPITVDDLRWPVRSTALRAIAAVDGELLTRAIDVQPRQHAGCWLPDASQDLALLLVLNRYHPAPPALAFVRGFGLERGALASSVAHDSHNLVAVGVDHAALITAVNAVVTMGGGLALADGDELLTLPLPIAGLMSSDEGDEVARRYAELDRKAHALGSPLRAPFMTLSFMALLVIPELKLSDLGLFDGSHFRFIDAALA